MTDLSKREYTSDVGSHPHCRPVPDNHDFIWHGPHHMNPISHPGDFWLKITESLNYYLQHFIFLSLFLFTLPPPHLPFVFVRVASQRPVVSK